MALLKLALIVVMAVAASLIGLHFLSPAPHSSQPGQQNSEIVEGTNGKHFSLDLSESVNVKGSP